MKDRIISMQQKRNHFIKSILIYSYVQKRDKQDIKQSVNDENMVFEVG